MRRRLGSDQTVDTVSGLKSGNRSVVTSVRVDRYQPAPSVVVVKSVKKNRRTARTRRPLDTPTGDSLGVVGSEIPGERLAGLGSNIVRPVSEILELFSGLETNCLSRGDCYFDPRLGISSDTSLPISDLKNSKTAKFDSFPTAECLFHLCKDRFYGLCSLYSGDIGSLRDTVYQVCFDHVSSERRRSVAARFLRVNESRN